MTNDECLAFFGNDEDFKAIRNDLKHEDYIDCDKSKVWARPKTRRFVKNKENFVLKSFIEDVKYWCLFIFSGVSAVLAFTQLDCNKSKQSPMTIEAKKDTSKIPVLETHDTSVRPKRILKDSTKFIKNDSLK